MEVWVPASLSTSHKSCPLQLQILGYTRMQRVNRPKLGGGKTVLPLVGNIQIILVHRQSQLEGNHEQAIRYDRRRSVTFGVERVLDERRQHLVDLQPIPNLIPAPVQQDMCQPSMMSRGQLVGPPPNGICSPLDVVQDSEYGLQITLFSGDNGCL